jgi:hypothetical protein
MGNGIDLGGKRAGANWLTTAIAILLAAVVVMVAERPGAAADEASPTPGPTGQRETAPVRQASSVWVPTPEANLGLVFRSLPRPCRVYDSRAAGGILEAASVRELGVKGTCEVPDTARQVVGTIAATGATVGGYFTGYARGAARPVVATLNFSGDHTTSSAVTLPLRTRGALDLAVYSSARSHLILDVVGYYEEAMQGRIATAPSGAASASGTSHFSVRANGVSGQTLVDVDRDITGCAILATPDDIRALAAVTLEDHDTFRITTVFASDQAPVNTYVYVHVAC